jgi:hypothetical protein
MGHAARVEGNRNAHRLWLDNLKESDHLEDVSLDDRAVCRKLVGFWTEFIYCSTGTREWALVKAVVNRLTMENAILNFSVKISTVANTVNSNSVCVCLFVFL